MKVEVTMPRMGQSMEEGVVLRWLKAIGDVVKRGEPLVEIETDKATLDVEALVTGTLVEILVAEGTMVAIGTTIAVIEDSNVSANRSGEEFFEKIDLPVQPEYSHPLAVGEAEIRRKTPRLNASPLAKRLAQEHSIDLLGLKGSGPGGRIGKEDIRLWLKANLKAPPIATAPAPTSTIVMRDKKLTRIPLSKMKQVTAHRMVESKGSVPHFYVSMDIEMSQVLALRESLKVRGHYVSVNDLILKATTLALVQYPNLNATFAGDAIERHADINLAVAVALGERESEGLLTPIIPHAQRLSLLEIAAAAKAAIERARAGRLRPDDLNDGTFTVSNLGMFGVKSFEAILNPPHAAILAVGAIRRVPVFDTQDRVIPAHLLTATVSADHRVSDGAEVARFLREFKGQLEDAFSLVSAF